jgi:hypothetical protein
MAEKKVENKETTPLLMESLTIPERVMLGQMTSVGGFKVLVKLFDAAVSAPPRCSQADQRVRILSGVC